MIQLILVLLFIGFVVWLIQTAPIPVHPWIKTVVIGLIFFCVLIWILNQLGVHTGFDHRLLR